VHKSLKVKLYLVKANLISTVKHPQLPNFNVLFFPSGAPHCSHETRQPRRLKYTHTHNTHTHTHDTHTFSREHIFGSVFLRRELAFTQYCYYQYCMVHSIQTRVRRGGRILPNNRALVLHQGGQCRWAGGMNRWWIRAQQPRRKTISCKGQNTEAGAAC